MVEKVLTSGKYFFFTLVFTEGLQHIYTNKIVNKGFGWIFVYTLFYITCHICKAQKTEKQVA